MHQREKGSFSSLSPVPITLDTTTTRAIANLCYVILKNVQKLRNKNVQMGIIAYLPLSESVVR